MARSVSVIVVDDHSIFRAGVVQSLALDPQIRVIAEGSSAHEAEALAERLRPDIALIDVSMPGGGIEAARAITQSVPETKVVMLTVSENDDDVFDAVEAGAIGYILKGTSARDLISAVQNVASGQTHMAPKLALALLARARRRDQVDPQWTALESLTPRERTVLSLVAKGLSNREVATTLQVGEKAVKSHLTGIFGKLKVRNRTEATLIAKAYEKQIAEWQAG